MSSHPPLFEEEIKYDDSDRKGTSSSQKFIKCINAKINKKLNDKMIKIPKLQFENDLLLFKAIEYYREKNYSKAMDYFNKILSTLNENYSELDIHSFSISVKAKFYQACMLFHGNGVDKDVKSANELFHVVWKEMKKIPDSDDDKLFYLARMKDEGWGTRVNKREALIYYIRSTKRPGIDRNAIAFFNLGLMYYLGEGVNKSLEKTRQMYAIASSMGHMSATYNLAVMYRDGVGGARNPDEALRLYLLNAKRGDVKSMNSYALMNKQSNPEECIYWLKKAIERRNAYAMYNYAFILERGELGLEQDIPTALQLYQIAAESGHVSSVESASILMKEIRKQMCMDNI